jgi:hypothetical protein
VLREGVDARGHVVVPRGHLIGVETRCHLVLGLKLRVELRLLLHLLAGAHTRPLFGSTEALSVG